MKIIATFVYNLYTFKYNGQEFGELERLLEEWEVPVLLEEFFESNKSDLSYFEINVETAIRETKTEH